MYIWFVTFLVIGIYIVGVIRANKRYKKWPKIRIVYWIIGIISIALAIIGPLQQQHDFVMHMYSHLLIGMISPLLISLANPLTLLLRNLSIKHGRELTAILKSTYFQIITHPIIAMIINIGGLWFIYFSGLFHVMHEVLFVNVIIHIHLFLGGYVFTIAILSIPPMPRRENFKMRVITLIIFMALHNVLAKWLYANPLIDNLASVQKGAMIMYYGGGIVDVLLIIILLHDYYKPAKRAAVIK